ncbi:MAG: hypothetical protein OEM82_16265, partial [Acidobacteriota bacterium]|nr:hypothetical protein [Acidobacteriota bacterium]
MPAENPNIESLISDLKERLLFMRELGVEEISASLAVLPRIKKGEQVSAKASGEKKGPDRRIPPPDLADLMVRTGSGPEAGSKSTSADTGRRNLLGATKLSDMANKREKTPVVLSEADEREVGSPALAEPEPVEPVIVQRKDSLDESVYEI